MSVQVRFLSVRRDGASSIHAQLRGNIDSSLYYPITEKRIIYRNLFGGLDELLGKNYERFYENLPFIVAFISTSVCTCRLN